MTQRTERTGIYIAATSDELNEAGPVKRSAALINQRVLFRHRGAAELQTDRLVLLGWDNAKPLVIRPADITRIRRTFTALYGRFVGGGSAEWGAPVIIARNHQPDLYLLFDHRAFLEKSSNVDWQIHLVKWLESSMR